MHGRLSKKLDRWRLENDGRLVIGQLRGFEDSGGAAVRTFFMESDDGLLLLHIPDCWLRSLRLCRLRYDALFQFRSSTKCPLVHRLVK